MGSVIPHARAIGALVIAMIEPAFGTVPPAEYEARDYAQAVLTRSTLGAEENSLVGIAIGEVVSLGLTGLAASVLEGTTPVRLSTHLVVGGIWMGVAACACLMPAAWVSRVDPIVALPHD